MKSADKHAGMMRLKTGGGGWTSRKSKNVMEIRVPSWKMDAST